MSTGIVAIQLHQLPYNGDWLRVISTVFFVLNVALFVLFTVISCARYIAYPELFRAVLRHPHQSLFLGAFPVGLATILNMVVLVCAPVWGQGWVTLAWVLWWIDGVLALVICFQMAFVIMSNRKSDLAAMTALWLIPIMSVVIVSSSGGLLAAALPNPEHRLWTLIISYVLWGIGMPLAWMILVLYFVRLTIHEPPPREVIVSVFLPIGPLGLGVFSLVSLGKVARDLFPTTKSLPTVANAGDMLYVVSFFVALIMWGFALIWFFIAVATIAESSRVPFNMGWWGFVFPLGIFALSTSAIGLELESRFFKVLGTLVWQVLTACVVLLWIIVAVRTVQRSFTGTMFFAPCLGTDMKAKQLRVRKLEGDTDVEKLA
ncbi:MAG: hypothetical protein M1838_006000 [Thelocarpon superellum]|nr:MAG: hypothetical protein M1838_006000 [Thelocarpon superellum]